MACPWDAWPPQVSGSEFQGKHGEATALPHQPAHLMMGLKRMSRVLMNMVGCTMYRALIFFLYLQGGNRNPAVGVVGVAQSEVFSVFLIYVLGEVPWLSHFTDEETEV